MSFTLVPDHPARTHARASATFRELFGVEASQVIAAMDAAGDDVPGQAPAIRAPIDAVGMTRPQVLVRLRDPFQAGAEVSAICAVRIRARVPADRRGLHISRIGDALADCSADRYDDLGDYARRLATSIAAREYGAAEVRVDASVPCVEDVRVDGEPSPKRSVEQLELMARVHVDEQEIAQDTGLSMSHLVACPCVQQMGRHMLKLRDPVAAAALDASGLPFLTHSQRCRTSIVVGHQQGRWPIPDLLAALDGVLHRTVDTLSRPCELALVYRAHRTPQFIEDALRAAVAAAGRVVLAHGTCQWIEGQSRSTESIHAFDLEASTTLSRDQLVALVKA